MAAKVARENVTRAAKDRSVSGRGNPRRARAKAAALVRASAARAAMAMWTQARMMARATAFMVV